MNVRQLALGVLIVLSAATATATGLGSAAKAGQLRIGMSAAEVRAVLGDPGQSQAVVGGELWRYSLHQWWVGWVPHYLLFAGEPARLQDWAADYAEHARDQAAMLATLEALRRASGGATPAAGAARPGTDRDLEACKRRYRYFEDRIANCY